MVEHEWQLLKGFFQEWFLTERGHFKAAFNPYSSEDDFETQLEKLLRKWIGNKVAGGRVMRWPIEVKGSPFRGLRRSAPSTRRYSSVAATTRLAPLICGGRPAGRRSPYLLVVGGERVRKILPSPRRLDPAADDARRH